MRIVLATLFCASFFLAQAQERDSIILKNRWLVGGNAKLFVESISGQTGRLIIEIDPQAGYFFTNWFAVGVRMPLSFTSDAYRIGTSIFTRYYLPTKSYVKPFAELNGGASWRRIYDLNTGEYDDLENCWLIGSQLGAAFFFNPKVSIDFYLYTSCQQCTQEYNGSVSESPLYITFGLGAGFQVYL